LVVFVCHVEVTLSYQKPLIYRNPLKNKQGYAHTFG